MGKMDEKAKKRVAVARDVLKQLAAKKIEPSHAGHYVRIPHHIAANLEPSDKFGKVTEVAKCEVCALGAMFIGHVNKFNSVTVRQAGVRRYEGWLGDVGVTMPDSDDTRRPLRAYFSDKQLSDIECEYEGPPATSKFARYRSASGRLRAIMQNIIDNRGTFTP